MTAVHGNAAEIQKKKKKRQATENRVRVCSKDLH